MNTICLPSQDATFDHEQCIVTGWGRDDFGDELSYQSILKKIEIPIVAKDDCETKLRKTKLGQRFKIHESFLCAGGEAGKGSLEK